MATQNKRNIVITGFMGTGKTTVGRRLAQLTRRPFIDTDDEVVRRAGIPIPQIFEQQGEAAFRALEKRICRALSETHGLVIATGGGMLVDPENRQWMLDTGFVVCLDAPPETIWARIAHSGERPLKDDWRERLSARQAAYAAIPFHVDTADRSPDQVAQEILKLWQTAFP